jgi:hypothetical protein
MTDRKQDGGDVWVEIAFAVIGFAITTIAFILTLFIQVFFWAAKSSLSRRFNLQMLSAGSKADQEFYRALKWLALGGLLVTLFCGYRQGYASVSDLHGWLELLAYLIIAVVCGMIFSMMHWIGQYARDPDVQRQMAGRKAEAHVQQVLERVAVDYPNSRVLHGALLVFQGGTAEEFSVEIDHLFVTPSNIFLVETKYKSGAITPTADAKEWRVIAKDGSASTMRNALVQAKNSVNVLRRQISLPVKPIPLVVVHGAEVRLIDAPGNVITADRLPQAIAAFVMTATATIDPEIVLSRVRAQIATDEASMTRHVARAAQARERAELQTIVDSASY